MLTMIQSQHFNYFWSPNNANMYVKVSGRNLWMYQLILHELDENLDHKAEIKNVAHHRDSKNIIALAWQSMTAENRSKNIGEIIALSLSNGDIKFLHIIPPSKKNPNYEFSERILCQQNGRVFDVISWNPYNRNMFAQVENIYKIVEKSVSSVSICDLKKLVEVKVTSLDSGDDEQRASIVTEELSASRDIPDISKIDVGNDNPTVYKMIQVMSVHKLNPDDMITSFSWIDSKKFVCGCFKSKLQIYDITVPDPISEVRSDAVYCVTADNFPECLIASFFDKTILIWKESDFTKAVLEYVEDSKIRYIDWHPRRQGFLCVTFHGKDYIKILDVKTALFNAYDDLPQNTCQNSLKKTQHNVPVLSATWHRKMDDCIVMLCQNDRFEIVFYRTRRSFGWTHEGNVVVSMEKSLNYYGKKTEKLNVSPVKSTKVEPSSGSSSDSDETIKPKRRHVYHVFGNDISSQMYNRVQKGYGSKAFDNTCFYSCLFPDNREITYFWSWIENLADAPKENPSLLNKGNKFDPYEGALGGLSEVADLHINPVTKLMHFTLRNVVSQPEEACWSEIYAAIPFPKYRHSFRSKLFLACGWPFDKPIGEWRHLLESLPNKERAAAMAFITLNFDVGLQFMKRIPEDENVDNNAVRLSLAGLNFYDGLSLTPLWKVTYNEVLLQLGNSRPYLRLIFNFLSSEKDTNFEYLKEADIVLPDRLAIAALYMDDKSLIDFINYFCEYHLQTNTLEMVFFTGLKSEAFLSLLQAYLNRSGDVQTVAIAFLRAFTLAKSSLPKSPFAISWVESYRSLLNQWKMFLDRAEFDVGNNYYEFCKSLEPPKPPSPPRDPRDKRKKTSKPERGDFYVICNYCRNDISEPPFDVPDEYRKHPNFKLYANSRPGKGPPLQRQLPLSACAHCYRPLASCSVCLLHMQRDVSIAPTATTNLPDAVYDMQNWFAWCEKCKHVGHLGHIYDWFRDYSECPVSGCECKCFELDYLVEIG